MIMLSSMIVETAVDKVKAIIKSEHLKRERIAKQYKQILEDELS